MRNFSVISELRPSNTQLLADAWRAQLRQRATRQNRNVRLQE
jgi:hypothetical protein